MCQCAWCLVDTKHYEGLHQCLTVDLLRRIQSIESDEYKDAREIAVLLMNAPNKEAQGE